MGGGEEKEVGFERDGPVKSQEHSDVFRATRKFLAEAGGDLPPVLSVRPHGRICAQEGSQDWPNYESMVSRTHVVAGVRSAVPGIKVGTAKRQHRFRHAKSKWDAVMKAASAAPELLHACTEMNAVYYLPLSTPTCKIQFLMRWGFTVKKAKAAIEVKLLSV